MRYNRYAQNCRSINYYVSKYAKFNDGTTLFAHYFG